MDLVSLVVVLIAVGVLLGLLNYVAPSIKLDGTILNIINVVVIGRGDSLARVPVHRAGPAHLGG